MGSKIMVQQSKHNTEGAQSSRLCGSVTIGAMTKGNTEGKRQGPFKGKKEKRRNRESKGVNDKGEKKKKKSMYMCMHVHVEVDTCISKISLHIEHTQLEREKEVKH